MESHQKNIYVKSVTKSRKQLVVESCNIWWKTECCTAPTEDAELLDNYL